jgi:hypothetical protein
MIMVNDFLDNLGAHDFEKMIKKIDSKYEHINDDPHDGWWLKPEYQDEDK